ncbi:hypothetical protein [Conexibacter sp. DBS9H8]|uniref:hypothetical protein n=1 Tax=Conexibacter sp. DBS9H8 TaxID=2937801 RepID=UPI00200FBDDD|nr:hypothetical protein [Conexibacter sp. DBS9H8]
MSTTTETVKPGPAGGALSAKPSPTYGSPRKLGDTARRDRWWIGPAWVVTSLTLFGIYTIVRVIVSTRYSGIYTDGAHLQSPMFSPDLAGIFGFKTTLPWSFLVLWAPLGMRSTCYYYRKSIYRSYFLAPPSCAVAGAARRKYDGETKFPFVFMNFHRFFWYAAAIVVGFLWFDAIRGLFYTVHGTTHFGVSLGSLIMFVDVIALSGFTFGCNSFRHLIGGGLNCFDCSSSAKTRHGLWQRVNILNVNHRQWAWISMFTVWGTDLYIWLAGSGVFTDPHHIF